MGLGWGDFRSLSWVIGGTSAWLQAWWNSKVHFIFYINLTHLICQRTLPKIYKQNVEIIIIFSLSINHLLPILMVRLLLLRVPGFFFFVCCVSAGQSILKIPICGRRKGQFLIVLQSALLHSFAATRCSGIWSN